ncbi:hypothetical protein [Priestia taiwanensis]|uniref:Uncharacterized protein n=1 Tax=Priestia taiwanensis TaxID=1347902 RepID=A0A917EPH9_9BACI|nr:hypothetical protein [Priestia taiwanensis]MBM7364074.1 hypothetical protein [Priestia taiwanensis]GGE71396.1 hypothetical protein GCM10007140_21650 [Priestia taiwanensis]
MCAKKHNAIRTAKMARELMLGDKDVTASTVMVYSNDGINDEIKIEGLHPKSNEEIFSTGEIDWNYSVIYKIVDFTGKAEIGKVILDGMHKNNVTLKIEKIMWRKEPQQEAVKVEEAPQPEPQQVEKPAHPAQEIAKPVKKEVVKVEGIKQEAPKKEVQQELVRNVQPSTPKVAPAPVKTERVVQPVKPIDPQTTHNTPEIEKKYKRLLTRTTEICRNWDLGADIDDAIESLKDELAAQGAPPYLDSETIQTLQQLRSLKNKGINLEKLVKLV